MKTYCSILFFLIPFCLFAQKDIALKRTQYYNAGMNASAKLYGVFLHENYGSAQYKIYESQYSRQQQRIAILADQWASGNKSSKKINSALALVAKEDIGGAVKLMEGALKRKSAKANREEIIFLAELYELTGAYDKAEKLLNKDDNSLGLEEGLYQSWLLASKGEVELALTKTDRLAGQFASDTPALVQIKLQRSYIDTLSKDYTAAKAILIEAQYLTGKMKHDTVQQYWSGVVLGNLADLQGKGSNIDDAYRNAQSCVAIFNKPGDLQRKAWALSILGRVCKTAGANQQADTSFRESIKAYTALAAAYPQLYNPQLADLINEYVEVLRWFDRKEEYKANLEKVIAIRKELATDNYPFFTLQYAAGVGRLADQFVFAENDIPTAEKFRKQQMDILAPLYAKYPVLAGPYYSNALDHLGDINMILKHIPEGIDYLSKALEVSQVLYKLSPEDNKEALMNLLIRNGSANGVYGNNSDLAYQQLDRAGVLAAELNDQHAIQLIARIKGQLNRVKK